MLALALVFGAAAPAHAQELRAPGPGSAQQLLRRALANLEQVSVAARVVARAEEPDGQIETRSFIVLRHSDEQGVHTLLGGFPPGSKLFGVRILQVDTPDPSETRAYIHSPEIGIIPQPTPYRLVDPFLGRAVVQGNSLATSGVRGINFEILSRTPAIVRSEPVERLRVRPFRPSDYDVAELLISPADAVILESRYYVAGEANPIRVVETPRESMERIGDRLLPEMMIYTENGKKTSLQLAYLPLEAMPAGLFEPTRFHLQALENFVPAEGEGS